MAPVTVVVATFGDAAVWGPLAQRAIESVGDQALCVYAHRETLAQARNAGLELVDTEWTVFLDADDQLEAGYVAAMLRGSADVRAPAVRYVRGGHDRAPYVPKVAGHEHSCSAECVTSGAGNWIVIGACVRTELVRAAGGFRPWPVYEDFDLWMRVLLTGATVEAVPQAVYRACVRPDSRNRSPSMVEKNRAHREIVQSVLSDVVAA